MSGLEEPILSRLNRLDHIVRELQDIRSDHQSPKSSYASTTSSEGQPSFAEFSPERLEKHCRPLHEVMMEVERKGTLIERLAHAEDRILKLCAQMEEELEGERSKEQRASSSDKIKSPKKGLKKLVKSCVGIKPKHKSHV